MKLRSILFVAGLVAIGVGLYRFGVSQGTTTSIESIKASETKQVATPVKKPLYWHDPMNPSQRFDKPGKSPYMDMQLVPVYADEGSNDGNNVRIDPRVQQNLGVRTVDVIQGKIESSLTAVGNVAFNERDVAQLQSRSNGYVEHVYVRAPFEPVKKGQKLADVYVPDWVAAQEEYLTVLQMKGNNLEGLVDGARQRMRLAGMDDDQINQITRSGKLQVRLSITAPISGVISELTLREGMTINPGAALFRINGLSSVWINAELPESLAALVRPGDMVEARAAALSGVIFKGRVNAILPDVNPTTRTLKARIELPNPRSELVPGMFVTIHFLSTQSNKEVLLVPSEAVIQTGTRKVVLVEQAKGKFEPVDIETGAETNGQTEVKRGLMPGQRVVASGQFLIDSEASLKGTAQRMTDTSPKAQSQGAMK